LTKEQKDKLQKLRKVKNDKDVTNNAGSDQVISALMTKVEQLETLLGKSISALESRAISAINFCEDSNDEQHEPVERKRVHFNGIT
jgi:hypothetical protein